MMSAQAALFLASVVCGVTLSVIFDLFRAVRITLKPNAVITAVTDIIYTFIAFAAVIYCVWDYGSGKFRYYEILGLGIGSVIYFASVSRFVLRVFLFTVEKICQIFGFILKILLTPLRFLYKILIVPTRNSISAIKQRRRCKNAGEHGKQTVRVCSEPSKRTFYSYICSFGRNNAFKRSYAVPDAQISAKRDRKSKFSDRV